MNFRNQIACCCLLIVAVLYVQVAGAAEIYNAKKPYYFVDETVAVPVKGVTGEVKYSMRLLTPNGWGKAAARKGTVKDGTIEVKPLGEGLHIVTIDGAKKPVRFLAMTPPPALDKAKVLRQFPRHGKDLLAGKPFTILAMGDSVTATGDYEYMLGRMLERATGNKAIKVETRAYPGRSVDASVREFVNDVGSTKPQLAFLMYGLNDQICFTPLEAYLEQSEYIVKHLRQDYDADVIFLEPTAHIQPEEPDNFAFRTIGFAQSLRELGAKLNIPVAPTFAAIWGKGGKTIAAARQNLWPVYPPHYSKQLASMVETNGKGDTIHPNALGHLQMAKAVYMTIGGFLPTESLAWTAKSEWTDAGVVSTVKVTNATKSARRGQLWVYPLYKSHLLPDKPIAYDLKPGASLEFKVTWPDATKPDDLFKHPANFYMRKGKLQIPIVDVVDDSSHVYAILAPLTNPADFVRERSVIAGPAITVKLTDGNTIRKGIPAGQRVGREKLIKGNAIAEVAWTQFGGALTGEAEVDGDLKEWSDAVWSVVGEPCQARWTSGPNDLRKSPEECYIRFATKAGKEGIYFAFKAMGNVDADSFTLYFDPRDSDELGSVGPYYWCSGSFKKGRLHLRKGETTKEKVSVKGAFTKVGDETHCEFLVPYALMDIKAWPAKGDLGFSLVWQHKGAAGITRLMWAEDGHPWNTRWYGVIRKIDDPKTILPYRVRVK